MTQQETGQPAATRLSLATRLKGIVPVVVVAAIIIGLDQWSKSWVRANIPKFDHIYPLPFTGDYFRFQHVDNYGAAFGILQGHGYIFVTVAFIVSAAILYYAGTLAPTQRWVRFLLGLQMGGALGNVIDRLYQGYVTDFVQMGIPGVYYWPNYNVADAAIVCGVIGLGIYLFRDDFVRHRKETAAAAADAERAHSTTAAPSRES